MTYLTIAGQRYPVAESLGFNHDIGGYVKFVTTSDGERAVVKVGRSPWRFWTARDRLQPLGRAVGQQRAEG